MQSHGSMSNSLPNKSGLLSMLVNQHTEQELDAYLGWGALPELHLAECVLHEHEYGSLNQLDSRIKLREKKRRVNAEINALRERGREKGLVKLLKKKADLQFKIEKAETALIDSLAQKEKTVCRAYIMFESSLDKIIFQYAYDEMLNETSQGWWLNFVGDSEFWANTFNVDMTLNPLLWQGKQIEVEPAPEPSNLLWENADGLPKNFWKRQWAKYGANIVSGSLLLFSFIICLMLEIIPDHFTIGSGAESAENRNLARTPLEMQHFKLTFEVAIPATFFFAMRKYDYLYGNPNQILENTEIVSTTTKGPTYEEFLDSTTKFAESTTASPEANILPPEKTYNLFTANGVSNSGYFFEPEIAFEDLEAGQTALSNLVEPESKKPNSIPKSLDFMKKSEDDFYESGKYNFWEDGYKDMVDNFFPNREKKKNLRELQIADDSKDADDSITNSKISKKKSTQKPLPVPPYLNHDYLLNFGQVPATNCSFQHLFVEELTKTSFFQNRDDMPEEDRKRLNKNLIENPDLVRKEKLLDEQRKAEESATEGIFGAMDRMYSKMGIDLPEDSLYMTEEEREMLKKKVMIARIAGQNYLTQNAVDLVRDELAEIEAIRVINEWGPYPGIPHVKSSKGESLCKNEEIRSKFKEFIDKEVRAWETYYAAENQEKAFFADGIIFDDSSFDCNTEKDSVKDSDAFDIASANGDLTKAALYSPKKKHADTDNEKDSPVLSGMYLPAENNSTEKIFISTEQAEGLMTGAIHVGRVEEKARSNIFPAQDREIKDVDLESVKVRVTTKHSFPAGKRKVYAMKSLGKITDIQVCSDNTYELCGAASVLQVRDIAKERRETYLNQHKPKLQMLVHTSKDSCEAKKYVAKMKQIMAIRMSANSTDDADAEYGKYFPEFVTAEESQKGELIPELLEASKSQDEKSGTNKLEKNSVPHDDHIPVSTEKNANPTLRDHGDIYLAEHYNCESAVEIYGEMGMREAQFWASLGRSERVSCFCENMSYMALAQDENVRALCTGHLAAYAWTAVLFTLGSFGVVVMNHVLEFALSGMRDWSSPLTRSKAEADLTMKLFFMEFVNTAFIILLVNQKFGASDGVFIFGRGEFQDFEFGWYVNVGVGILLTMCMNMLSPHIPQLFVAYCKKKKRKHILKSATGASKCKNDILKLYTNGEFEFSKRYAQILATVFVVLMYSAAIPVLLWIAFFTFASIYAADKWMVLRFTKIPPAYDAAVAHAAAEALPWAALIHLVLAIWMYGHPVVFPNDPLTGAEDDPKKALIHYVYGKDGLGDIEVDPAYNRDEWFGNRVFNSATIGLVVTLGIWLL